MGKAALNSPVPQAVLTATGLMGMHGTPKMPIYACQAVADEIAPIEYTDALVCELCPQGVTEGTHCQVAKYTKTGFGEEARRSSSFNNLNF
ncbi:hypothetical protein BKA61DRAFT_599527 [Leptodontidium sp. MPI-SDFR-AT-0119]|nr:hypothetical protein BKA61DRAFT_599527 [Leptodontidium sp. MPI-SDFR-AT-0119]